MFTQAMEEAASADARAAEHGRQLAVAALLVEMMRADRDVHQAERDTVARALTQIFSLPDEETEALLELADSRADDATSLFEFTSTINDRFEPDEKIEVVEMLWRVAHADGEVDKHEAHLVRKIADLLHLRHREYIAAKLRAESPS
ncbi:MAG: TerB family tellurite resistance protein [Gammaproteobacteria bacterium]|nr:TerB family tellurite resistance protein [Gammaproteobacteria bacterium]